MGIVKRVFAVKTEGSNVAVSKRKREIAVNVQKINQLRLESARLNPEGKSQTTNRWQATDRIQACSAHKTLKKGGTDARHELKQQKCDQQC